jgi:hypothetical protein
MVHTAVDELQIAHWVLPFYGSTQYFLIHFHKKADGNAG